MAQTPEEIRAYIERQIANAPELQDLNEPDNPRSSVWNIVKSLFTFLIYVFQNVIERFRLDVIETPARTLSLLWYETLITRYKRSIML